MHHISFIFLILAQIAICIAHGKTNLEKNLETIILTDDNFVSLRGPVTSLSISKIITELISKTADVRYIFISTNGGSVDAGLKLINLIQNLKDNGIRVDCIAETAISMGFVIFQSCTTRYVLRHSTLMQHQMSLGVDGKIRDVNSYMKYVNVLENEINKSQAERIGLSLEEFDEKIRDDWWLGTSEAIENKVADKVIHFKCSFKDTQNIEIDNVVDTFFGTIVLTYARCPHASSPSKIKTHIDKEFNNKSVIDKSMIDKEVQKIIDQYTKTYNQIKI